MSDEELLHKIHKLEETLSACEELLHIREAEITQLDLELTTAKRIIVEADAAFNRDGKELPYDEARLGLVRMCHEGRAALDEAQQKIYCPSCGEWSDIIDSSFRRTTPGNSGFFCSHCQTQWEIKIAFWEKYD